MSTYYHHQNDKSSTAATLGLNAEITFENTMKNNNIYTKEASLEDNKRKHTDIYISLDNIKWFSVDVKAHKSLRRGQEPSNLCWVELLNEYKYKSYLCGSQRYISFEYFNNIYLVNRKVLQEFIDSKINMNDEIHDTNELIEPFKLYRRKKWNKNEIMTIIQYEDIIRLSCKQWSIN